MKNAYFQIQINYGNDNDTWDCIGPRYCRGAAEKRLNEYRTTYPNHKYKFRLTEWIHDDVYDVVPERGA